MIAELPASSVAQLVGLSLPLYSQWVAQDLLHGHPRGRCNASDALRAAVACELKLHIKRLPLLRLALNQLSGDIERLQDIPNVMDVVWDASGRQARWAYDDRELAVLVRLGRPVVVLPMAETLARVHEAFLAEAAARVDRPVPTLTIVNPWRT